MNKGRGKVTSTRAMQYLKVRIGPHGPEYVDPKTGRWQPVASLERAVDLAAAMGLDGIDVRQADPPDAEGS